MLKSVMSDFTTVSVSSPSHGVYQRLYIFRNADHCMRLATRAPHHERATPHARRLRCADSRLVTDDGVIRACYRLLCSVCCCWSDCCVIHATVGDIS